MENLARYIDGTLQDRDVHTHDIEFRRIPGTGRKEGDAWKFDFEVKFCGQVSLVTVAVYPTEARR